MIEETYKFLPNRKNDRNSLNLLQNGSPKQVHVVDNSHHFEKELDRQNLKYCRMQFIEKIGCYRIIINEQIFDFPVNWSIFSEIREAHKF